MNQKEQSPLFQSEKSETNITHYILHNKQYTLDNNTLDPQNESSDISSPADASGLASLPSGKVICSGVGNLPLEKSQIGYVAVTLVTPDTNKPERLTVNIDFRIEGGKDFNKLVFNLAHYNRRREFISNLEDKPYKDWQGYTDAYDRLDKHQFIGKGRIRGLSSKRSSIRTSIEAETAMIIDPDTMWCYLWFENAYFEIELFDYEDKNNRYCAKGQYIAETKSVWTRRVWK